MAFKNSAQSALAIVAIGALLSGCAGDEAPRASLVTSKSQVQLLGYSVAERVTPAALSSAVFNKDESEECGDGDPQRRWISSVQLNITQSWEELMPDILAALLSSYEAEGWSESDAESDDISLESARSAAKIQIIPFEPDADRAAHIDVVVLGPCVMTDGEDSDEVQELEQASK